MDLFWELICWGYGMKGRFCEAYLLGINWKTLLGNRSVVKEMYVVIFCMLYDLVCIMHKVIMLGLYYACYAMMRIARWKEWLVLTKVDYGFGFWYGGELWLFDIR